MLAMGLLDHDATRAPLLPLEDPPRARLGALLRDLGLIGEGGREAAPARTGSNRTTTEAAA
jgi:hypothetical protein